MKWVTNQIPKIQRYAGQPWYPVALGVSAFAYHFFLIVPVDTFFIASALIAPRRWKSFSIATSTGFTLGGLSFAYLVHLYGASIVEKIIPGVMHTQVWEHSEVWMQNFGALALGGISLIPFTLHPLVALAGLHHMNFMVIALSLFLGRMVKYITYGLCCLYIPAKIPLPDEIKKIIRPEVKNSAE